MNRKQESLEQFKKVFDCTISNHPYDMKTAVFNCPAYPYARMGVAMMEGGGMLLPQVKKETERQRFVKGREYQI